MSSSTNYAALMLSPGAPLTVAATENASPGPGELLIKNHAWAINPADWKAQAFGLNVYSYPAVLGCDLAGEVVEMGSGVTTYQVGDRIAAVPLGATTKNPREQAFQDYTIVPARCALAIPADMPYEEAVKLPLGLLTAAAGLFEEQHLNLPLPTADPVPTGKALLVWAGSSNVGSAAIQLALAAGVDVVTTASKDNTELVKAMGVKHIFDHHDEGVVDKLASVLHDLDVVGAFDPISSDATIAKVADILGSVGGGDLATTLPPKDTWGLPKTINAKQVQALTVFTSNPHIGKEVWENFMPRALRSGQIRPMLKTKVVGKGLESIQAGLDEVRKGVSGTKVVILA